MEGPATRLVGAFIEALSEGDGYAALRRRGGQPGYVHVVPAGPDPNKPRNRHVAIELFNGTVAVTDELREPLGAHPRPNARIEDDPLGCSAGPNYGRFKWALTHDEIVRRWDSELGFAREVEKLLLALNKKTGADDEGDYG